MTLIDFGDQITKIYQSRHRCRAKLSSDPKRRTGPNRKKMAKKSALFGVQKRLE